MDEAKRMVARLTGRGLDPTAYRQGIAGRCGVSVDTVDIIIAGGVTSTEISGALRDAERIDRKAWREWNHEEV